MIQRLLTTFTAAFLLVRSVPAAAPGVEHGTPPPYENVNTLVPLPSFLPGFGTLYVNPKTLPVEPFLAYDHRGRLVSTIYMVPLEDLTGTEASTS